MPEGVIKTKDALDFGIHPRTLYNLVSRGNLEKFARGIYKLVDIESDVNSDWIVISKKIQKGVVCLISALAHYDLTTQIPHEISIALPKGMKEPIIHYPPISYYHFSGDAYSEGVESDKIDGVDVSIYSVEKTIADCVKFRNKLGKDVIIEMFKSYGSSKHKDIEKVIHYSKICRVFNVILPYLEIIQ